MSVASRAVASLSPNGVAALAHARQGRPVFPCDAERKRPLLAKAEGGQGFKDASTDETLIRAWWSRWPEALIGMPTGAVTGCFIVDIDVKGEKQGEESWGLVLRTWGPVPETWETITATGGRHLWFAHPGRGLVVPNRAGRLGQGNENWGRGAYPTVPFAKAAGGQLLVPDVDIRGDGGYVILPGSSLRDGRGYAWEGSSDPEEGAVLATAPGWLLALVVTDEKAASSAPVAGRAPAAGLIGAGQRNDHLFRMGRSLRGKGLSEAVILAALLEENATRCDPPLPEAEVRASAASAASKAAGLSDDIKPAWLKEGVAAVPEAEPVPAVAPVSRARGSKPKLRVVTADEGDPGPVPEGPEVDPDWRQGLIVKHRRDGSVMVPCRVHNLMLILRCAPDFAGRIRYNEFLQVTEVDGQPMVDGDLARLKARIERTWMPDEKVTTTDLLEAVRGMEHENSYHPVRDYLLGLEWDGIPRIEAFFPDHLDTPNDPYHQGVARAFFLSAVGRIFTPGLKVDVMVILEGAQGKMKSSMWETLGGDWYADITDDINNKDFQSGLQGTWIADLGELDQFGKADSSRIKSIITIRHDRLRRPYARFHQTLSRQTVLVGSSNRSDWLNDPTGGRRFLPVSCLTQRIDIGLIARARDQLWAEATQRYRAGEAGWWDVPDAQQQQMSRFNEDPWHDPIKMWLGDRQETSTSEVLEFCLKVELARQTRSDQIRVGNVMLVLGWYRRRVRDGKTLAWQYFRDAV